MAYSYPCTKEKEVIDSSELVFFPFLSKPEIVDSGVG